MGQMIELTAGDGFKLGAYSASAPEPKGGVVVIQEIFGVNAHIREVVDGYAEAGYHAVAPALFDRVERGVELGYDEAGMGRGMALAFQEIDHALALADIAAAVSTAASAGRVGVVGYCFGGLMTWRSACELDGVSAASAYYGGGVPNEAERTPRCPVIAHFGKQDAHIPVADVERFAAARGEVEVHLYDADHGFNCDHRGSFDAAAADQARGRTLAHFAAHVDA
ncbi:MAG: dienelactone hydrolase family protein [Pseudomonadota bacterium]